MTLALRYIPPDRPVAAILGEIIPPLDAESAALLADGLAQMRGRQRVWPWGDYICWRDDAAVGCCGFKNAPGPEDPAEIGYMTFPRAEETGVATAMAGGLLAIAAKAGAERVIAHTLPAMNASARALTRNGFVRAGETIDPDEGIVWRWEHMIGR